MAGGGRRASREERYDSGVDLLTYIPVSFLLIAKVNVTAPGISARLSVSLCYLFGKTVERGLIIRMESCYLRKKTVCNSARGTAEKVRSTYWVFAGKLQSQEWTEMVVDGGFPAMYCRWKILCVFFFFKLWADWSSWGWKCWVVTNCDGQRCGVVQSISAGTVWLVSSRFQSR